MVQIQCATLCKTPVSQSEFVLQGRCFLANMGPIRALHRCSCKGLPAGTCGRRRWTRRGRSRLRRPSRRRRTCLPPARQQHETTASKTCHMTSCVHTAVLLLSPQVPSRNPIQTNSCNMRFKHAVVLPALFLFSDLVREALHRRRAGLRRLHCAHDVGHGCVAAGALCPHCQRAVAVHSACCDAVACTTWAGGVRVMASGSGLTAGRHDCRVLSTTHVQRFKTPFASNVQRLCTRQQRAAPVDPHLRPWAPAAARRSTPPR